MSLASGVLKLLFTLSDPPTPLDYAPSFQIAPLLLDEIWNKRPEAYSLYGTCGILQMKLNTPFVYIL